jgi:serine/threonine-protein kinase
MSSAPAPTAAPVTEGDILAGKYRVERVLGQGGMGVVVAATHQTLHQRVAVKLLLPGVLANPDTVERFLREARAAGRLKSEHAAKVVDVGKLDNGSPYMAMEYLEGATLGQVVRLQGPLPSRDAVDFVLQACEAVAEAHAAGIVHRDLKPENLFLTRRVDGQPLVKVIGFAIAKSPTADGLSLSRTSTVIGSPLYMPPEQLRAARHADARSDIWALGAVLFELVTGRVPFAAESFSELCLKVARDPPPLPSSLKTDVSPALDAVVLRCLEKEPARRFQNVADLAAALEPLGSSDAKELAARVASVLGGARNKPLPAVAPPSASVQILTPSAWGQTSAEASDRKRTWIIAVASTALGLGAIGAVFAIRPHAGNGTGAGASAAPSSSALAPAAPALPSISAVPSSPPPPGSAASAAPAASSSPIPPRKPPGRR